MKFRFNRSIRRGGGLSVFALAFLSAASSAPAQVNASRSPAHRATTVPGIAVPGKVQVTIKEWDVPVAGSMPSGIFSSKRDGAIWYSSEGTNLLGRFDLKSEKFEAFNLRPGSRPNALVQHSGSGVQSTLYFTSRDGGYIGEFDPETRFVREFRITGGRYRLENLTFDRNGVIWFTANEGQLGSAQGSKIGFLNLFSAQISLASLPTRHADPYSLVANSKGTIYFTERDSPRIGSVDPETMEVTEQTLPNRKIGLQGLTVTPDDRLWFTDSARGYVGCFDSATGKFEEWPSPSGPRSQPKAITSAGNVVWYAETGTEPNMLVRFDSSTHSFQSWPVTAGGGIGQIYAEGDDMLWLARTAANGIAQVKVGTK